VTLARSSLRLLSTAASSTSLRMAGPFFLSPAYRQISRTALSGKSTVISYSERIRIRLLCQSSQMRKQTTFLGFGGSFRIRCWRAPRKQPANRYVDEVRVLAQLHSFGDGFSCGSEIENRFRGFREPLGGTRTLDPHLDGQFISAWGFSLIVSHLRSAFVEFREVLCDIQRT